MFYRRDGHTHDRTAAVLPILFSVFAHTSVIASPNVGLQSRRTTNLQTGQCSPESASGECICAIVLRPSFELFDIQFVRGHSYLRARALVGKWFNSHHLILHDQIGITTAPMRVEVLAHCTFLTNSILASHSEPIPLDDT